MCDQRELINRARALLLEARRVVAFTGAGISAESGLPTYRGSGGLWSGFSSADLASADGFRRDPLKVWNWHNERRMLLREVKPNAGHAALSRIEQQVRGRGGLFTLATQNVDGLHQAAGSRGVLELHGTILAIRCNQCAARREIGFEAIDEMPRCGCGGLLRPDIVWFGESLPAEVWERAFEAARGCDVLLSVGTSAVVYPAAGLIEVAARGGAAVIEVNPEPTAATSLAEVSLRGKAGEILPMLVA